MALGRERRQYQRYALPSMYTRVTVRLMDEQEFRWEGHAYDVSVGGMRFELDSPIDQATPVVVQIELPGSDPTGDPEPVFVAANIVWLEEDDLEQPGPVRMACVFREFARAEDQDRLVRRLNSGRFSIAA